MSLFKLNAVAVEERAGARDMTLKELSWQSRIPPETFSAMLNLGICPREAARDIALALGCRLSDIERDQTESIVLGTNIPELKPVIHAIGLDGKEA